MKTAVVIDPTKIATLKERIKESDYIDKAVQQLAYELSVIFKN